MRAAATAASSRPRWSPRADAAVPAVLALLDVDERLAGDVDDSLVDRAAGEGPWAGAGVVLDDRVGSVAADVEALARKRELRASPRPSTPRRSRLVSPRARRAAALSLRRTSRSPVAPWPAARSQITGTARRCHRGSGRARTISQAGVEQVGGNTLASSSMSDVSAISIVSTTHPLSLSDRTGLAARSRASRGGRARGRS